MKLTTNKSSIALFAGFLVVASLNTGAGMAEAAQKQENARVLPIQEFLRLAASRDTTFEEILINELTLRYQKDLRLPPADLVLDVKQNFEAFLSQSRESPATTISLSRLFPRHGTELTMAYEVETSINSDERDGRFIASISQPIARNAFGRSTRLLDQIVGLETDIARYQIVEAYEDYFAFVSAAYHAWYQDHENLRVGRSSYKENLKLLDNVKERQQQKIALPVDVNKIRLQVLAKKERLVELEKALASSTEAIKTIIRHPDKEALKPETPSAPTDLLGPLDAQITRLHEHGRTFQVLRLLEDKSSLEVAREADDLLPSINLVAGYEVRGTSYGIRDADSRLFGGIELELPYPNRQQKAEVAIRRIFVDKSRLTTQNTYYRLRQQLIALFLEIERERALMALAKEKIAIAQAVVRDEAENYSYGKITLNDFIQAVNAVDNNRFSKILHEARYKERLVEWLRLTDQLVGPVMNNLPIKYQQESGSKNNIRNY